MIKFLGVFLFVIGIVFASWMGFYWAFIGGIILLIEQIRSESMDLLLVIFGITRVLFANLIFWVSASVPCDIGIELMIKD